MTPRDPSVFVRSPQAQVSDAPPPAALPEQVSRPKRIYYTFEEVAAMFGYRSTRSISRMIRRGELEARGMGSGRRIVADSVHRHPEYTRRGDHGRS